MTRSMTKIRHAKRLSAVFAATLLFAPLSVRGQLAPPPEDSKPREQSQEQTLIPSEGAVDSQKTHETMARMAAIKALPAYLDLSMVGADPDLRAQAELYAAPTGPGPQFDEPLANFRFTTEMLLNKDTDQILARLKQPPSAYVFPLKEKREPVDRIHTGHATMLCKYDSKKKTWVAVDFDDTVVSERIIMARKALAKAIDQSLDRIALVNTSASHQFLSYDDPKTREKMLLPLFDFPTLDAEANKPSSAVDIINRARAEAREDDNASKELQAKGFRLGPGN